MELKKKIIVFSDISKRFNFYQESIAGAQLVFSQNLAQDLTVEMLVTANLNGDAFTDILAASTEGGIFALYNVEGETFDIGSVSEVDGASHIEVFDLDLDGDLDIGYWSPSTETVYWTENLGNTDWQTHTLLTYAGISDILFIDLDGDGDQDLVTAHWTGTLSQLENHSNLIPR